MLSKSLIQFPVDGRGVFPPCLTRPNYVGGNEDNCNLLQKVLCLGPILDRFLS